MFAMMKERDPEPGAAGGSPDFPSHPTAGRKRDPTGQLTGRNGWMLTSPASFPSAEASAAAVAGADR